MAKGIKITPEQNAEALKREVQKQLRLKYLERFDEFIVDADTKIEKAYEAVDANTFAMEVMFESNKSNDSRAKDAIDSFQMAIDMTNKSITSTKMKREAAVQLKSLVDENKKILAIELLSLFDRLTGV